MINTSLGIVLALSALFPQEKTDWRKPKEISNIPKRLVTEIQLNRDGSLVASGSAVEKDVALWDTATGKKVRDLTCPKAALHIAFSPDGSRIAGTADDNSLRVWDVATGKEVWSRKGGAWDLCYSPDGKTLFTSHESVLILDASTGEIKGEIKELGAPIAIHPGGDFLAATSSKDMDDHVLWNLKKSKREKRLDLTAVSSRFAFGGESCLASLNLMDKSLELWNFDANSHIRLAACKSFVFGMDGKMVILGTDAGVVFQSIKRERAIVTIEAKISIRAVHMSADNKRLAFATEDRISIWAPGE